MWSEPHYCLLCLMISPHAICDGLRAFIIMLFLHIAQAQIAVCMDGVGCTGRDLGVALPRGCCIDNPLGVSYRFPGGEDCIDCTGKLLCQ